MATSFIPRALLAISYTSVLAALFFAVDAHSTSVSYSETVSGDLPYLYPGDSFNVLNLGVGQNTVFGQLSSPFDNDTFAFTVPQSMQVSSISLSFSQGTAVGYYGLSVSAGYGLSPGIGLPYAPYPNGDFAQSVNFSTGASPSVLFPLAKPLGAGTYTIGDFYHNNFASGYEDYTFTLGVTSTVQPPPKVFGISIGQNDESGIR